MMKRLGAIVSVVICAVVFPGFCDGQAGTQPGKTASAAIETKGLVQGRVVQEPGGQGIRKVRVILRGGREQLEATTDERGEFKIPGLEPGIYFVAQLERSGYVADGKANWDKTTIKVVAGQDTKDVVLRMLAAGAITGKIVDSDGDPLRSVDVVATASSRGAPRAYQAQPGRAATNDLGEYRIADLPPGKYILRAFPPKNETPPSSATEKDTNGRLVYAATYFPGTLDQRQAVDAYSRREAHKLAKKLPHPTDKLDEESARLIAVSQGLGAVVTVSANTPSGGITEVSKGRWQSAGDLASELKWIAAAGVESATRGAAARPGKVRLHVMWATVTLIAIALACFTEIALQRSRKPDIWTGLHLRWLRAKFYLTLLVQLGHVRGFSDCDNSTAQEPCLYCARKCLTASARDSRIALPQNRRELSEPELISSRAKARRAPPGTP